MKKIIVTVVVSYVYVAHNGYIVIEFIIITFTVVVPQ